MGRVKVVAIKDVFHISLLDQLNCFRLKGTFAPLGKAQWGGGGRRSLHAPRLWKVADRQAVHRNCTAVGSFPAGGSICHS